MPVSLNTHADIARALQTLGVPLDKARDLDASKAKDPELAKALVRVLKDVSPGEMKRLQATIGATTTTTAPAVNAAPPGPSSQVAARLPTKDGGKAPRIDANLPQVAVLLQTYGVDKKADRPLERVLVHVAKIHEILSSESDPKKLVDKVMTGDLRRFVFLLEGIGKLYERNYDVAGDVYAKAKELEDLLGAVSMHRSNLAYARHVKVPSDVEEHLVKLEKKATRELEELLVDAWMPDKKGQIPALKDVVKDWSKEKWDDYVDDKKYVRDELVRRLTRVADTEFDMRDLQGGIHELRRQLRWFPIYAESVNGLIQLDVEKNPVAAYKPMLDVKLATSKYVDLPNDAREVDAIRISKSLYTALMQLTLDLGGIKDAGEPLEAVYHAWIATGRAEDLDDARAKVLKHIGSDQLERDVHEKASALYAEMKKNKLVEELARSVKKG
jgi:hypothetical protein